MSGRRILWVMLVFVPLLGWGQSGGLFHELLYSAPINKPEEAIGAMEQFTSKLQLKRARLSSDEAFLLYVFRESHKTFFHHYKAYSQFPEIFNTGHYDCLSATSLLSVVLEKFGFQYKIMETNYHIFLLVDIGVKQVLLESTDKVNGFVSDRKIVDARLKEYEENNLLMASSGDRYFYQYDVNLFQPVMSHQLRGLLLFNQAVSAYNSKDLSMGAMKLKEAMRIISSPRMAEFAIILVTEIADSNLSEEEKKSLIRPFAQLIKAKASVVAAR